MVNLSQEKDEIIFKLKNEKLHLEVNLIFKEINYWKRPFQHYSIIINGVDHTAKKNRNLVKIWLNKWWIVISFSLIYNILGLCMNTF